MSDCQIICGDSLLELPTLAANSVDACVTDPPYELGFMGKTWDSTGIAYNVDLWLEVFRILKPGAHLVAFGGTRTYHRMACAIEDAGFEIRDQLQWLYGSGFPKSLDVSKAIDKMRTEDVEPTRAICRSVRQAMDAKGLKSKDLVSYFDDCHPRLIDHWAARDTDSQPSLPTVRQWFVLKAVLQFTDELDAEVFRLNERKGSYSDTWQNAEVIGEYEGVPGGLGGQRFRVIDKSIRAATDEAKQWNGWGTALKPANEPICLARKPLEKGLTVAQNVLKWGTGAINVDACRVPVDDDDYARNCSGDRGHDDNRTRRSEFAMTAGSANDKGRFPANVIHDGSDEVLEHFPHTASGVKEEHHTRHYPSTEHIYGKYSEDSIVSYGDAGSASRFFYCAKADKSDRHSNANNNHPTVKPVDLMRWLCRLITPPNGTILDPFLGSGSTAKAALIERFKIIGIEIDPEYAKIADARCRKLQVNLI